MKSSLAKTVHSLFVEPIHEFYLDNGLKVIVKEDPSFDIASVQVWVKTGSIYEDQYLGSGISHYVEHMLFKGTPSRTYKQISDEVQSVGGFANAYTTFDRTVYYIDLPSAKISTALDVLSDILFNSLLDPLETDKERSIILREIDMDLDDPSYQLSRGVFTTVFKKNPYRYPVIGDKGLFLQLTRDHLFEYYHERYAPNNMVLIITGNVKIDTLLPEITNKFGKYVSKILKPILVPDEPKQLAFRHFSKKVDVKLARGIMSFNIPGLAHPDNPALAIFANLLGQGDSSHLWQTLRETKKLVDSISASVWSPGNSGLFWINYTCEPSKAHLIAPTVEKEIKNFVEHTLTQKKLEKTIRQAMVSEINSRKTMSGQASRLGVADVVIGDIDYPKIFIQKLQEVSIKQLQHLYPKYFFKDNQTHVLLEPEVKSTKKTSKKQTLKIDDFEEIKLDNGATLLLQHYSKLPKINLQAILRGGPVYETEKTAGITALLSSLLVKDTKKRKSHQVSEAIEQAAGSFFEFAGNNTFGLLLETLDSDFPLAIDLLEQAILYPKFLETQLDLERDSQIADIKSELDEIFDQGLRILRKKFFGNHPYSNTPLGTIESLESIQLEQVKHHYHNLISSHNAVFSLSGSFIRSKIINKLIKLLNKLPPSPFTKIEGTFTDHTHQSIEIPLEKEQVVIYEAYPAPGITDPLVDIAEVFCELLNGMSSQLFIDVREKLNMAYYVGASQMLGLKTGMFILYAGTNQENYRSLFESFDKELTRIKEGNILPEEIDRAKTRLKSSFLMSLQSSSSRAHRSGLDYIFGFPVNYWRTYPDRIDAVTLQSLQQFAHQYLQNKHRLRLSIGRIKQ